MSEELPRLLYVADVGVAATSSGPLHLYRLLKKYPADRLLIAESSFATTDPGERLPEVRYVSFDAGNPRWLSTRVGQWYGSWLHARARWNTGPLSEIVKDWHPDAILSVWHNYSWLTAARVAEAHDLPLHLIVHDDVPNFEWRAHPLFQSLYQRDFQRVYRQAASQLCVSPYMEEEYRNRYGVSGTVMYPVRNWGAPDYEEPPFKLSEPTSDLVVAYSGSLHTPGFRDALRRVAEMLESIGGHLLIFSHIDPDTVRAEEWTLPSMDLRPFVPQEEIIPTLRREADVLFLPMAFNGWALSKNRTNFPSKLAEYTATGLPLLVWGPEETSGVRWARSNPGVAEVITSPDEDTLQSSLNRLANDPDRRMELGNRALEVGDQYFHPTTAWSTLCEAVRQETVVSNPPSTHKVSTRA